MSRQRPLFVVLEGIDGSGTTTQVERLVNALRQRGRQAVATREPSRGPIGLLLREILLGGHRPPPDVPVDGDTMALLFAADRKDHLQREIEPQLAQGHDVISDRFVWSSLAYQAQESDLPWVASLARNLRAPDLTILLDLPIAQAAERRTRAGRPVERYDEDSYLDRVARHYRRLADEDANAVVLDGSGSVEDVSVAILRVVEPLLTRSQE